MNLSDFALADWLHYLEHRHHEEIQLGLVRVQTVAQRLNVLDFDPTVITVAGTNGKGSTVAALEAIYSVAGYNVGSYTSPHLIAFNERIRSNLIPITDEALCSAFMAIENARGDIHLTYFEVTTLAALLYFKSLKLDIIVLEVGMGGRLDATNIIDSDLAIITTVDLDHQAHLGETIEAIAHEKAGILRANKPYIYADGDPPKSLPDKAALLKAPRIEYSFTSSIADGLEITPVSAAPIHVPLPRLHPNAAAAAIMSSDHLKALLPVTQSHWEQAMREVFIPGRQEVREGPVRTVFDVAHNPQAAALLSVFIQRNKPKGKVHAVFSGLKDKDLCGLIKPMRPYVDIWYPARLSGKRAADESQLLSALRAANCLVFKCFDNPFAAYQEAMKRANPDDLIVVYGSFLTVSAVMSNDRVAQEELG